MNGRLKMAVGVGLAALVAIAALVGAAGGKTSSITLKTRTAGSLGKVLAAPNAHTLYRLKPETKSHLLCKDSVCLSVWKPLTVKSKSTTVKLPAGVTGTVGYLKRGTRFQVTLSTHPLYTFVPDKAAGDANGQNIHSFGGTWLVTKAKAQKKSSTAPQPQPQPDPMPGY